MRALRVRFTLRGLMLGVVVIALILYSVPLTTLFLVLAGSILAIRVRLTEPIGGGSRRWAVPYLVTLACLYLPFAWVLGDYPWDDYRWHWIKLWPVLPGLIAGMLVHPNDSAMLALSGLATFLLIGLFTALGALGRRALVLASVLALSGAVLESMLAYQLFLF